MTSLSDRERRLVALLILVAAITLAWLAVASPIIAGFEARAAERERLALVQASNQRLIDNVARLRRQAEAQKTDMARFHVIAPTAEAAAEQLKDRVSTLMSEAGAEVRALQDIEAAEGRIELRIEARVGLMVVRTLSVSAPAALGGDPATSPARKLDIRIDVAASHSPA